MITIRQFLCALEHLPEMPTIYLRAFLDAQHEVARAQRPGANFNPRVLREAPDHHRPQGSHKGEDESHSPVCVQESHGQLRTASQEMHGALWSSRTNALEHTRIGGSGGSLSCFDIIFTI